ncbi:MAG: DUF4214 domain-containing protein [Methylococcales bacterium]
MVFEGYIDQVQKMYIAYYGRPAEAEGLDFWAGQLALSQGDLSAIIDLFASSEEFQNRFGGLENDVLVKNIFNFVFNREADTDGLNYYVGNLDSGAMTLATVASRILSGARDTPSGAQDATMIANKVQVGNFFSVTTDKKNAIYGENQIDSALNLLSAVTEESDSVQAAVASATGLIESFPTYNKILGDESSNILIATEEKDVLTGGAGEDTFRFALGESVPTKIDRITDFEIGHDRIEFGGIPAEVAADFSGVDITDKLPEFVGLGDLTASLTNGVFDTSKDVTFFSTHNTFEFAISNGLIAANKVVAVGFKDDTFVIQNVNNQVFNAVWLVGVNIDNVAGLSTGSEADNILIA